MLRLTHTISTGTARVVDHGSAGTIARRGGARTGSILGNVFADWNANGTLDQDEGPLEGIPVRVSATATAKTAPNGQFTFLSVPAGPQEVGLDTGAIPIDFDPPAQPSVQVELASGETERVAFGLIPLGSIAGRVIRDVNANAAADPGEEPIDGAIVVLDGGTRSEQTRRGRFRFDAVRSGEHDVQLLVASLGDAAKTTGPVTQQVALTRDHLAAVVTFLVSIDKRPEIRRVFPSRTGGGATPPSPPATTPTSPATDRVAPPTVTSPPTAVVPPEHGSRFAVQISAVRNGDSARALAKSLQSAGYPAYVLAPSAPKGFFRIRVGPYPTRAAAEEVRNRIARERGVKGWVTRDVTAQ